MNLQQLRGTGIALVTPFTAGKAVDFDALAKLIDAAIAGGVEYLVSLGTTGETATLSATEKKEVLAFTIKKANGRVPIVAGFGGNNTQELIQQIHEADLNGVSAILSVSPYYNKPTQAGIINHYTAIADASPLPIILYNVPGRTGSNINAETTIALAKHKNIIGIKEASGNFSQCMQIVMNTPTDFLKISGDDNLTLPLLALGFDGVISVSGQGFPTIFTPMVRAALAGDYQKAKTLHYQLVNITDLLFIEGNPAGIKLALQLQQIGDGSVRMPLEAATEKLRIAMKLELDLLKL